MLQHAHRDEMARCCSSSERHCHSSFGLCSETCEDLAAQRTRAQIQMVHAAARYSAVLEQALSTQYTTLTKGTTIAIAHHGAEYYLEVVELEPEDACLIIDTGSTVVVAGKSTVAGRVARVRPPLLWAAQKNRCRNGQPHKAGSSACASYFECMS
eukprot:m.247763 g.247763  ORF g.247763 m.247763 type:complete len:155 (-) comp10968_c3_seq79:1183-1647(-)